MHIENSKISLVTSLFFIGSDQEKNFQNGDPVWAKIKKNPPWPAVIVDFPPNAKASKSKKGHHVLFFGTKNFTWIEDDHINPHNDSVFQNSHKTKSRLMAKAIEEFENYLDIYAERLTRMSRKRSSDDNNGEAEISHSSATKVVRLDEDSPACTSRDNNCISEEADVPPVIPMETEKPGQLKIGFIGLGTMGGQIVKTLLRSGHDVTVWNRTENKCDVFVKIGAKKVQHPADLIVNCDVTLCCVTDSEATSDVMFCEKGVLKGFECAANSGAYPKGYVELSSIDSPTSQKLRDLVNEKRGMYLEAPLCGSSKNAKRGNLLILAAGEESLFKKCKTCFNSMGKKAIYLSADVGTATQTAAILSAVSGTVTASLAEAMGLIERLNLAEEQRDNIIDVIKEGPLNIVNISHTLQKMTNSEFQNVTTPLYIIQKDLSYAELLGNNFSQPMRVTAAANEVFKDASFNNFNKEDMTAVYKLAKI